MSETFQRFGVIGAGAWGTALAQVLARGGRDVTLWAHDPAAAETIARTGQNPDYLPDVTLEPSIRATSHLGDLEQSDAVLSVVPAQHTREVLARFAPHAADGLPVLLCSKGIERASLKLMAEVLAEEMPGARTAVLTGPSFAIDVARGLPTAVTLACADEALGEALARAVSIPAFRLYSTTDLVGAEIGGSVKNVLAIAAGVCEGRELGKSAHAALVTRGFAEMVRLGQAIGGRLETLSGLCGLGDLMLTCSSPQSRNMSAGIALGRGKPLEAIMASRRAVTEGVATAPALAELARGRGVDMPICAAVDDILAGRASVDGAIEALLARPLKSETS